MSIFFIVVSIDFLLVSIFFLVSSLVSFVRNICTIINKEDNWERYIIALGVTAFMGVIALGISTLSFIASRHF